MGAQVILLVLSSGSPFIIVVIDFVFLFYFSYIQAPSMTISLIFDQANQVRAAVKDQVVRSEGRGDRPSGKK